MFVYGLSLINHILSDGHFPASLFLFYFGLARWGCYIRYICRVPCSKNVCCKTRESSCRFHTEVCPQVAIKACLFETALSCYFHAVKHTWFPDSQKISARKEAESCHPNSGKLANVELCLPFSNILMVMFCIFVYIINHISGN